MKIKLRIALLANLLIAPTPKFYQEIKVGSGAGSTLGQIVLWRYLCLRLAPLQVSISQARQHLL